MPGLAGQIRRNLVAIISLIIAVVSLGYNTWRNERSEYNRTIRTAGIETLLSLGALEQVTYLANFDPGNVQGSPRIGWAHARTVSDLSMLLPDEAKAAAVTTLNTWEARWRDLGERDQAVSDAIVASIDANRAAILEAIRELD
ncbi:MAG: hypothetical protein AAFX58_10175 [Pseudomonadota bacterium]